MNLLAKCPSISHPDWKYSVEKLGHDRTLYLYKKLGEELPTKEQVDAINLLPKSNEPLSEKKQDQRLFHPEDVIAALRGVKTIKDVQEILKGYKNYAIDPKLKDGKLWVGRPDGLPPFHYYELAKQLADKVNEVYPGLLNVLEHKDRGAEIGRGLWSVEIDKYYLDKYFNKPVQGALFKENLEKMSADIKATDRATLQDVFSKSRGITDAYEYMHSVRDNIKGLYSTHKELMNFMDSARSLNPNMRIKQINSDEFGRYKLNPSDKALAIWNPIDKTIYLFKDRLIKDSTSVISGVLLHEMIHGFTNNVLWRYLKYDKLVSKEGLPLEDFKELYGEVPTQKELEFARTIEDIYNKAKELSKDKGQYGYTDLMEFAAEGLSDQKLIDELKSLRDPKDKEKLSLWQRFKSAIAKLFGMDSAKDSYHDRLLSSVMDYVYNVRRPNTAVENIQSAKLSDNIKVKDDTNPMHDKLGEVLKKLDETYRALAVKFEGVTQAIARNKIGGLPFEMWTDEKKTEMEKYSSLGTETHYQIEKSFTSAVERVVSNYKLTLKAEQDLKDILTPYKKAGCTIFSEVTLPNFEEKLVGKADLIIIDKDNKVHLFDFKTKAGGFGGFDKPHYPRKGEPQFLPVSDYFKAQMQLSAYKLIFEDTKAIKDLGLTIETLNVIPLKPEVDFETKVISGYSVDKSFNGRTIIPIEQSMLGGLLYENKLKTMDPKDHQETLTSQEEDGLIADIRRQADILYKRIVTKPTPEQEIVLKSIQALEKRMAISGKRETGSTTFKDQLNTINTILKEKDTTKQLTYIVQIASGICNSAYNRLQEIKASGEPFTHADLFKAKEAVSAFDILDKYSALLNDKYGLDGASEEMKKSDPKGAIELNALRSKLASALKVKNTVKFMYESKGLNLLADTILPYYTKVEAEYKVKYEKEYRELKREKSHGDVAKPKDKDWVEDHPDWDQQLAAFDPTMTEEEYVSTRLDTGGDDIKQASKDRIIEELHKAGGDVGFILRWAGSVLDSPDAIVGVLAKTLVIKDSTARIEIENKRLEMLDRTNKFYELNKELGHNYTKAYDIMSEKDLETGTKRTGNYVSKFHSSLIKMMRNMQAAADAVFEGMEDGDKRSKAFMDAWKGENMPEDKVAKKEAFLIYIDELASTTNPKTGNKYITTKEWDRLRANVTVSQFPKMAKTIQAEEGGMSDGCVDLVEQWYMKNSLTFRNPSEKWINPQWTKLKKLLDEHPDDPRSKMYDLITELQEEGDSMVPISVRLGTRFPGIIKDERERFGSGQSLWDITKGRFSRALTFQVDDTSRVITSIVDSEGKARSFVPAHFTGMVTKTVKDAEGNEWQEFDDDKQSYDLANIYFHYWGAAKDFQWKNDVLPEMEMARYILENRDVVKKKNGQVEYIKSRFLPTGSTATQQTIKGGNISKQFDDWLLYVLYGQQQKDLGTIPGTNIDAGKLVNVLQRFTALSLLGLNYTAGINSFALTEILTAIEAAANKTFGGHEWATANGMFYRNLPGMAGDIASKQPKNIVSLLLREFNVAHQGRFHNLTQSSFRELSNTNGFFNVATFGWKAMQIKTMLAMLEKRRAYDKEGKDIGSILSLYKVRDGKLIVDTSTGFNETKSKWDNEGRRLYEHTILRAISKVHGDQSDMAHVAMQSQALTSMALMFRRFVVPTFLRRWGGKHYSEGSGEWEEGMYDSCNNQETYIYCFREYQSIVY